MNSKLTGHIKQIQKPEKESDKSLPKLEPKPKESSSNLALKPQNEPSNTQKKPRNLALKPQNESSNTQKKPRNLALKPQNKSSNTQKKPRNLALKPQNDPSNTQKKPKNLALGMDNKSSIPQKGPVKGLTRQRYSEKDVRNWIQQYKHYNSFQKVRNHLLNEGKKVPGISTMKTRMKQLMGQEKYKELMKKYTFKDVEKIVKTTSIYRTGEPGRILSKPEEFKTVKSKLSYQCGKCNHSWKTSVDAIINNKTWCPKCAVKNRIDAQRGTIGEHKKIITEKGGKLIKVIYEDPKEKLFNQRTRFKVECKANHKFEIKAQVLKRGSWCRECSYKVIGEKLRGSFKDIQNLIEKRGGKCLTKPEDYRNQHQNLTI